MSIHLFATVHAKSGATDDVAKALTNMLIPTRAEKGCLRYELFFSEATPSIFHLIESYADDAALELHQTSPHFTALVESLSDKLAAGIQIERWVQVD